MNRSDKVTHGGGRFLHPRMDVRPHELLTCESYLLVCLSEECGELTQAVAKWLRWGKYSKHPERDATNNLDDLRLEAADVVAVLELLKIDIDRNAVNEKKERLRKIMDKQRLNGMALLPKPEVGDQS